MINILKADFRKFFSGKLFIVMTVLGIGFPLLSAFLYRFATKSFGIGTIIVSAEDVFYGSFSPLNNYGLILMIFMLIILLSEFNQNTIRNKVVAGYSRNTIYLSSTVFNLSIVFVATSVYSLLTYFLAKYLVGTSGESVGYILSHWLVAILATMILYAFLQLIAFIFKSFAATFGIMFGGLIFLSIVFFALQLQAKNDVMDVIIIFIPFLQLFRSRGFSGELIPWMLLTNIAFLGLLIGLGTLINKKLDYK